MNLRLQEHPSGLPLQTGIRPQVLQMIQTRAEGLWSLLQLGLVASAGRHERTTSCSADPSAFGFKSYLYDAQCLRLFFSFSLVVVLSMSVSVRRLAAESCSGTYVQFVYTQVEQGCRLLQLIVLLAC